MPVTAEMRVSLTNEVGAAAVQTGEACHGIAGRVPELAVRPESVEGVCATLRWAQTHRLAVVPWGNGTLQHLGHAPERYDVALKFDLLNKIIDYPAEDMTITVNAGICLGCLQKILAKKGQYLPINPPRAAEATLGGLIATGAGGPRRLLEGTLRDFLLGIKVVKADGQILRGGSRVVKDVAGYDLCKLFTGSFGTLGVIVEATLKLRPLPESEASAWCEFENPQEAEAALAAVLESDLVPVFLEYLNGLGAHAVGPREVPGWAQGRAALLIGFDGAPEAAGWQSQRLRSILGPVASRSILDLIAETQTRVRERLFEFRGHPEATLVGKANVPSSEVTRLIPQAEEIAGSNGFPIEAAAHAGNGIVYLRAFGNIPEPNQVAAIKSWTDMAVKSRGSFVVERAPWAVKEQVEVWGPQRSDFRLMRAIKETLDPNRILNPGRFVGKL